MRIFRFLTKTLTKSYRNSRMNLPHRYFRLHYANHANRGRRPRSHSPSQHHYHRSLSPPHHKQTHRSRSPIKQHYYDQRPQADPLRNSRFNNGEKYEMPFRKGNRHSSFERDIKQSPFVQDGVLTQKWNSRKPKDRGKESSDKTITDAGEHIKQCVQEAKELFHSDCQTISEVVQLLINEDSELEERLVGAMTKCLRKIMNSHMQHLKLAKELHTTVQK
uniref:Uncharacterized protein LOC100183537 n=1 Tax=Phallusia mammillata TaxID=59560 RepID=A0A6F9DIF5_9ASCI|nr:uncharacterized protein LOC100183537 [Phallusia mammillata]